MVIASQEYMMQVLKLDDEACCAAGIGNRRQARLVRPKQCYTITAAPMARMFLVKDRRRYLTVEFKNFADLHHLNTSRFLGSNQHGRVSKMLQPGPVTSSSHK